MMCAKYALFIIAITVMIYEETTINFGIPKNPVVQGCLTFITFILTNIDWMVCWIALKYN